MSIVISVQVHKYIRRAEQQQINIAQLNNPKNAAAFEKIVNGADHPSSEEDNRRPFQIFLHINQTPHLYLVTQHGMLTESEFEELARVNLSPDSQREISH